MNLYLVEWEKNWYLASQSILDNGAEFVLIAGALMPCAEGFRSSSNGRTKMRTFQSTDGMRIIRELQFRGMQLHPTGWVEDSRSPLLRVMAGTWLYPISVRDRELMQLSTRSELHWTFDRHGSGGSIPVEHPELMKLDISA